MAGERYRYDSKGKLVGFSSDQSPFQRGCSKVLGIGALGFFGLFFLFGGGTDQETSYEPLNEITDQAPLPEMDNAVDKAELEYEEAAKPSNEPNAASASDQSASEAGMQATSPVADMAGSSPQLPSKTVIDRAMRKAFEAGQPVRWESNGLQGYAIPSAPQEETGCRSLYYSIDSRPDWQSKPETIC